MSFPYKHVLLVGATAGIGQAMAHKLIESGCKVTAVGRRQTRLEEFVKQHGTEKASAVSFDVVNTEKAPQFAADVMKAHPDIDCVFLNAGKQGSYDFCEPSKVDLKAFNAEFYVNFMSAVCLVHAFLPYLLEKNHKTGIIFTGTHVAVIPAVGLPAYSASKAALNSFVMCLRHDLRNTKIKVVDILPPVVQTEIHDYMGVEKGSAMGMPVGEFTELAFKGLVSGTDEVIVVDGIWATGVYDGLLKVRKELFEGLAKMIRG